jgi:tetratricopeptide (TPR) repeat protein
MLNREGRIAEYIEESLAAKLKQAMSEESQAEAHLIAAELYQALGDLDKSLEESQQAYEIDRSRFRSLAVAKVRAGQVDEMVRLMADIYEEVPEDRLKVAGVLSSGLVSGKPTKVELEQADEILVKAMDAYPRNVGLWASVASVRVLQERQAEGIALLEQALLWSPDSPIVLNNLATLLIESDDSQQKKRALSLIDRAIGNLGRNPALLDTRGMVLFGLGRVDEAVNNLTQASRRREADARVHFHLAVALLEQAKASGSEDAEKSAETAFHRSLEMGLEDQLLTGKDLEFLQRLKMKFSDKAPKTGSLGSISKEAA